MEENSRSQNQHRRGQTTNLHTDKDTITHLPEIKQSMSNVSKISAQQPFKNSPLKKGSKTRLGGHQSQQSKNDKAKIKEQRNTMKSPRSSYGMVDTASPASQDKKKYTEPEDLETHLGKSGFHLKKQSLILDEQDELK